MFTLTTLVLGLLTATGISSAQSGADGTGGIMAGLITPHAYVQKRVSSYDRTGANADAIHIAAGATATILDESGPGIITHIWFTIASPEDLHLKKLVLRMYWDDESSPSVEAPIGDFFGLGLGQYFLYESAPLSVAPDKALNAFFQMPFRKKARITVTNQGQEDVDSFYYNIDYRAYSQPLPSDTLYFHAEYRQATPAKGWTTDWKSNGDPLVNDKKNLNGDGNYVWMEATGRGHFVGVTMSVLQNQDGWWGEGDDMFFVDGEKTPSINGTGTEDYFLGAWDFGSHPFSYASFGAPVKGEELAGSRSSVYRFHLDSPIPFTRSFKATIEHGHANARSDNMFSVAYWYQTEPHAAFPPLPSVEERIPRIYPVGGPGNAGKNP
ncbi:glycoside hydrolase family 172 protein [Acidicapsa ligni]|uniref:glycoside hydrolase family 172 protein n=1 Tax=Acidicapsa ligni TaxID=542300 RepID=UPI0021E0387E|nr:glycoside hydrolase family 172 protein [Acidicapsa ligni]